MHQQLKAKHAELFKKIVEQQEELRKVSEQLLMTQYGLVPVNVASLPFPQVSTHAMVVSPQPPMGVVSSVGAAPMTSGRTGNNSGGPPMGLHNPNNELFGPLEMQMGYANVMPPTSSSQNASQRTQCHQH